MENDAFPGTGPTEAPKAAHSRRGVLGRALAVSGGALFAMGAAGCSGDKKGAGAEKAGEKSSVGSMSSGADGGGAGQIAGVLGANFNEAAASVSFEELDGVSAGWLRGFAVMTEIKDDAAQNRAVKKLLAAHRRGFGTVLSLKFPYNNKPVPKPGSPEMKDELAKVDKVLEAALDSVDILVIGNEPFIESVDADKNSLALNEFYEKVAAHVIEARKKKFPKECRTRLYMGALNHIDEPDKRTKATERWLAFAKKTPQLEGVDIHPHVDAQQGVQAYLDYVLPRLRKDQKFLVTEFSLMPLWRKHLTDKVSPRFADQYKLPKDTPVWKVIKQALEQPFPEKKWHDFLAMSPWFENNKHFLRDQMARFRKTGRLAVATYGVTQSALMGSDFGPKKDPWLLNSLYANRTVEKPKSGLPAHNYGFFDDFKAAQRPQDRKPVKTGKTKT
ncbi:hypothetical protein [Streptomyces sp. ODS28]|uniref:hypothetical protein n=1 Tax=Streptomyces sp. ODS28 TaxID=3136688 RepID=UPI0031F0BD99